MTILAQAQGPGFEAWPAPWAVSGVLLLTVWFLTWWRSKIEKVQWFRMLLNFLILLLIGGAATLLITGVETFRRVFGSFVNSISENFPPALNIVLTVLWALALLALIYYYIKAEMLWMIGAFVAVIGIGAYFIPAVNDVLTWITQVPLAYWNNFMADFLAGL